MPRDAISRSAIDHVIDESWVEAHEAARTRLNGKEVLAKFEIDERDM